MTVLDQPHIDRFTRDLNRLISADERIGLAVSGGPDSIALLLLGHSARPGLIEAITVDHGLRPEAKDEAAFVASICAGLSVPHSIRTVEWRERPTSGLQEQARHARYALIAEWMADRRLGAVCTAHHADDQAETLLMRLARGSGVRGLAAMRPSAPLPGKPEKFVIRPLLNWRSAELAAVCGAAGVAPVADPSNDDAQFERVRIRQALTTLALDSEALARSASNLASADEALDWAVERQIAAHLRRSEAGIFFEPGGAPAEIRRRVIGRIIAELASEGPADLRGAELENVLRALDEGEVATLRGVRCSGGATWRFERAPPRSSGRH